MKVLIFINTSWNIVNFRTGLIRALQKMDIEVHALAPEDAYSGHLSALGVNYHPIAMDNSGNNPVKDLLLLKRIYRAYQAIQPDLILHYTIKPNIYGALAAYWSNIPCINTVSGLGTTFLTKNIASFMAKRLYRWSFVYPKMIFFQNAHDLSEFQNLGLLRKSNYQVVLGSGVNSRAFTPQKAPSRRPFTFLMMARLLEEKGVREYAAAAEILQANGLPVICNLIGNSESTHRRGIPSDILKDWTTNGFINYFGEIEDVRPYLAKAHVVVLPSYREGLPKSLLEAASMAKPIVATRVPGCTEVVKDQINGLLCEPKDAIDLAEKMKALYHLSEIKLENMGQAGRAMVIEEFEEHIVIEKYLDVIRQIIT